MNSLEILSNLNVNLSINSRKIAKNTILDLNISAQDVLNFIKISDERNQVLLICVLDYIIEEFPDYLNESLNDFILLQENFKNETCKRCTSRIVFHILKHNSETFDKKQKNQLIDIHFDWLISNSFVATRVNCLSVIFELRNEAEWIKTELIEIIEQQIILQEPSFVSRAKKILAKIHKEANR